MPYDCTKFANCWKGKAFIQSCGPGTHFNARYSVCDWPNKANCALSPVNTTNEEQNNIEDNTEYEYEDDFDTDEEIWDLSLFARSGFASASTNQIRYSGTLI